MALLNRSPAFIIFFFHGLRIFLSSLNLFKALRSLFLSNYPSPTFIQGPTFILFVKISRPYVYFLSFVYSGLQSTSKVSFQRVVALGVHFATSCQEIDFYEAFFFHYQFSKRKRKCFEAFNHLYS